MQLLVKKLSLPIFQTHQSQSENFIQAFHSENNSSWYFALNDLTALSYDKKNDLSVFHLNIKWQILGISESRLKTDISTTTNIQLPGFNIEHIMPTKSANGGALCYTKDTIYKLQTKTWP